MLSSEKCKALLNDDSISDEEIESIRSALYDSAQLAFEVFWGKNGSKNPNGSLPIDSNDDKV